jgi:tetratricopeptide (TPR) repeat protein
VKNRIGLFYILAGLLIFGWPATARAQNEFGEVSFANSGAPAAQGAFLQGLAQLHNFEYEDAAKFFRIAEQTDPNFAMAYWGEAMSFNHPIWMEQNRRGGLEALSRLAATPEERLAKAATEREKDYLRAVEILYGDGAKNDRDFKYCDAMAGLHQKYPTDVDGAAFYALSILGTAHEGRDIPTYMRAAAILEDLFYAHPRHPGAAHYLIHSFDDPIHAPLGLRAARAYSAIAPNAAHAQHMTSHIFLALGMWDDVVRANETAVAVSNRELAFRGGSPMVCGHYPFWLEYGYLQQGRFADARRVLAACRDEAARSVQAANNSVVRDTAAVSSFMDMKIRYILDTQEWNGEVSGWSVETGEATRSHFYSEFIAGYSSIQKGDLDSARSILKAMQEQSSRWVAPENGAPVRGVYSPSGDSRKAPEIAQQELEALVLAADGHNEEALAVLQKAAAVEETMPFAFGPPEVAKPTFELIGELLLKMQRPADARKAFETSLDRAPERTSSLMGLMRAAQAQGDVSAAQQTSVKLQQIWHAADRAPADLR